MSHETNDVGELNDFEELVAMIDSIKDDAREAYRHDMNKAAARRVRKTMLAVRDRATAVRKQLIARINES